MTLAATWLASWRIASSPAPTFVRRSLNEIWRAQRDGQVVYLRITPQDHRRAEEVQAEVAWMDDLVAAGLPVVKPLRSTSGHRRESIVWQGAPASVVCLAAAPGRAARKPDDYTESVITRWAQLLAQLHAHAQKQPSAGADRALWSDDRIFETAMAADDEACQPATLLLRRLAAWMGALPTPHEAFGLTHADLHLGNLAVDDDRGGALTVFDFDDACRHWYVHDLAVAVTSIRKAAWEYPGCFDGARLEALFVEQYAAASALPASWLMRLEGFVAYRIALSACWASRTFTTGGLEDDMLAWYHRSLPWWLAELAGREAAIADALAR